MPSPDTIAVPCVAPISRSVALSPSRSFTDAASGTSTCNSTWVNALVVVSIGAPLGAKPRLANSSCESAASTSPSRSLSANAR